MIFLYKTTNLLNGKFYIGVHEGNINDNYLGSGVTLKKAIKKYGIINFKRDIIKIFTNSIDAYLAEAEMVTIELINNKLCYNETLGGRGGWYHCIRYGDDNAMRRPSVAKKCSEALKLAISPEERKNRSNRMKKHRANGTIKVRSGFKQTDETKQKLSLAHKGRQSYNKGKKMSPDSKETRLKKKQAAIKRAQSFDMGSLTRGKKYNMKIVTCPYCKIVGKGGNMTRYHFEKCKFK